MVGDFLDYFVDFEKSVDKYLLYPQSFKDYSLLLSTENTNLSTRLPTLTLVVLCLDLRWGCFPFLLLFLYKNE